MIKSRAVSKPAVDITSEDALDSAGVEQLEDSGAQTGPLKAP